MLTTLAGAATIVGGYFGTHRALQQKKWLSIMLAFAAGAMVCVALIDLLPEALESFAAWNVHTSYVVVVVLAAMVVGAVLVRIIDRLIPGSNSVRTAAESNDTQVVTSSQFLRSGIMITAIIAIHNVPEGLVTFMGALHDVTLGVSLAVAIALHNIPEGISIASPIYIATGSRKKAMRYTVIAALAEPLGALLGYILLLQIAPEQIIGLIFAASAGMMVYVSLNELIPSARLHATRKHEPIIGLSSGAGVMAMSLLVFNFI